MIVSDQRPPGPDWLLRRIEDLERQMRELQAGRRLEAATIGAGGLTVRGGTIRWLDPDGNLRIYFGPIVYEDNVKGVGWLFYRANGALAFSLEGLDPDDQFWAFRDESGNIVVSDDSVSGRGLATPYLSSPMGPSWNSEIASLLPGTTQSAYTGLWEAVVPLSHPRLRVRAIVGADDGLSSGQARITIDGVELAGTATSFSAGGPVFIDGSWPIPDWTARAYLGEADIALQARRTAGSGRIVAAVYALYGMQSES